LIIGDSIGGTGMSVAGATVRMRLGIGAPGYSFGQREVLPYDRRVKITMTVTLAPELTEAIKESADRHGVSFDLRRVPRPVRGPGRMTADEVPTSDPGDLRTLRAATGFKAVVIDC
jgi:hypothetical protein